MPDYLQSKIYKIWSPSENLVYYGSTIQSLAQRLAKHKSGYKRYNNGKRGYCTSFLVLDCEDYKIELVEEYPCNNKQQLEKQEGEYIKINDCVNKVVVGRTPREYYEANKEYYQEKNKNYYQENKEKKNEYLKKWRQNNPEKVKEHNNKRKQKLLY